MATLTVTTITDFRGGAAETDIDEIEFTTAAVATFGSDQFGAGLISDSVLITGNDTTSDIVVILPTADVFSAAGWTFATWLAGRDITLIGSSGSDTITGSAREDRISGHEGADILDGGASNDVFLYTSTQDAAPGEQIAGGGGVLDSIDVGGALDFSGVTITGVERLNLLSSGSTVTFLDNFGFTSVVGNTAPSLDSEAIVVGISSGNVDLSGVAFTDWTPGEDTITINGSAGANTLTGSNQNDTINGGDGADTLQGGGAGADVMNGGDGDDTFKLTIANLNQADILNGGNGIDTIEIESDSEVYDLGNCTLTGIERLVFAGAAIATLAHEQIGSGNITSIVGSSDADILRVDAVFTTNPVTADLSAVSFLNWSGNDTISIRGHAGNDRLTGSDKNDEILGRNGNDIITGGLGADALDGGGGDDVFKYTADSELVAGETIFGDAGTDTVQIENGSYDFSAEANSIDFNAEILQFVGASQTTAIFETGTASSVVGSAGVNALVVNARTIGFPFDALANLSGVAFTSWTAGQDTITINGLAGSGNTLTGSSQDDAINGGTQADTLNGGAGNDVITGGLGNDAFNGGAGDDTAAFSGNRSSYALQVAGNTIVMSGLDGTDTLTSIERLQFTDGAVDLVNDGSALFDTLFYLSQNPDVFQAGVDPLGHFNTFGFHEGRDPNAWFDTSGYLGVNKDVAAAGVNPLDHFHHVGWKEGRDPSADFDTTLYLLRNPDVAAAGIDPLEHFLQSGISEGRQAFAAIGQSIAGGFDGEFYLFHNPDVAAAGIDPFFHYSVVGWQEGRDPNAWFDTSGYLSHYTDVAAAGIDPLFHYMVVGWTEGRDPSAGFDTLGYLATHPDVAAAGINPLDHFLRVGIYEGRAVVNDGLFH
jgi:Ca2+-binding RTX toxin-like protein